MTKIRTKRLRSRDNGASAVEYGVLLGLITVIVAASAFAFGGAIRDMFSDTSNCLGSHVANSTDTSVC